jgi:NitT/TauT family transport system permease protein
VERGNTGLYRVGVPLLGVAVVIAAWWLATIVFHIGPFLLPSPPDIVAAFWQNHGLLLSSAGVTLGETAAGFGIAAGGGLLLAMTLSASRLINRAAMPMLVAANAIPKLAVAPLLVVWMGFGQFPKIVMVTLICFFPILLAATAGLNSTPADLGELARMLCTPTWKTFLRVKLPWALPQILTGLKVAVSLAVIGAVVAENSGSTAGLGYVIVQSQGDTALAFASVTLLAVESIGLFYALAGIERLLVPWARETTAQ